MDGATFVLKPLNFFTALLCVGILVPEVIDTSIIEYTSKDGIVYSFNYTINELYTKYPKPLDYIQLDIKL